MMGSPKNSLGRYFPSIPSFYKTEEVFPHPQTKATSPIPDPFKPGDGFTEEELANATDPLSRQWDPDREYEELSIDQLIPGPKAVTFMGRVVNFSTRLGSNPTQPKATGWHWLVVKDDSAAISIKLFFAQKAYPLALGQLVSFWTVFVSDHTKGEAGDVARVGIGANMFPGRVTSDHVMIYTSSGGEAICRVPLAYKKGEDLEGLMTVDCWLKGGYDSVSGVRLLGCVKSLGPTKKLTTAKKGECELVDVVLFDHTGEVKVTFWNELAGSVRAWEAGRTILLISNPAYRASNYGGKGMVVVQFSSMIDICPDFPEAEWLGKYALGLKKKESLCLDVPEGLWDVEAAEHGVVRILFTLAELDRWVRADTTQSFTGFINVTVMDMSLVCLQRRNMLMCAECCGVPIYANALTIPCKNCAKPLSLALNPCVIGTLLDETGCIAPGKLLWSPKAWEQLFGRSVEEICRMSHDDAKWFEQRMLWLRCHLVVGWAEQVGRLVVLAMKM